MARYRVDNKYLSEKEYSEHVAEKWTFMIVIFASIFGAAFAYYLSTHYLHLNHVVRFAFVLVTMVGAGTFAFKSRYVIRGLVTALAVLFALWLLLDLIYMIVA